MAGVASILEVLIIGDATSLQGRAWRRRRWRRRQFAATHHVGEQDDGGGDASSVSTLRQDREASATRLLLLGCVPVRQGISRFRHGVQPCLHADRRVDQHPGRCESRI